jgi:formylglycine-generating enzyme required for sulfatase activity/SAM-dependent methyltransferase
VELGKPHDFPSFGWDNEYGTRTVEVEGFQATKNLITNGEFLEFVKAGGYNDKNCWTEAGWQWRRFRNVLFPVFWVPNGPVGLNQYKLRTIFDIINLPLSWPVDVNAHEAAAFCNWRASLDSSPHPYRLISEVEHHLIRDSSTKDMSKGHKRDFLLAYSGAQMWDGSQKDNKYNTNLAFGSSTPVDALAPSDKGFRDTFGNVWQWTADDFNMLDGFEVHPLYLDFSSPCFDGLHTIILGGSFISTGDEASIFSRFHFRPHFSQHAGFRMATGPSNPATILPKQGTNGASVAQKDASSPGSDMDVMMLAHYGSRLEVLQWENGPSTALSFPTRIADHLQTTATSMGVPLKRALDMGCAVGRSSFHLAMGYDQVVGVDLCTQFIDAASELKREGQCMYKRKDALGQMTEIVSSIDNVVDRTRVEFHVDDACSVSPEIYGTFDGILVSCLLEYVHSPKDVLANLSRMVTPGGLIVIATSNIWSEAHTPRSNWLSTTDETSLEGIAAALGPEFSMKSRGDMANLNRVNTRKFEWIMLEVSVWQKA